MSMQGFLQQRRRDGKWIQLYCRLREGHLLFYRGVLDDKPLANFSIRDYSISALDEVEVQFAFKLGKTGISEHILAAENEQQFQKWMQAFADQNVHIETAYSSHNNTEDTTEEQFTVFKNNQNTIESKPDPPIINATTAEKKTKPIEKERRLTENESEPIGYESKPIENENKPTEMSENVSVPKQNILAPSVTDSDSLLQDPFELTNGHLLQVLKETKYNTENESKPTQNEAPIIPDLMPSTFLEPATDANSSFQDPFQQTDGESLLLSNTQVDASEFNTKPDSVDGNSLSFSTMINSIIHTQDSNSSPESLDRSESPKFTPDKEYERFPEFQELNYQQQNSNDNENLLLTTTPENDQKSNETISSEDSNNSEPSILIFGTEEKKLIPKQPKIETFGSEESENSQSPISIFGTKVKLIPKQPKIETLSSEDSKNIQPPISIFGTQVTKKIPKQKKTEHENIDSNSLYNQLICFDSLIPQTVEPKSPDTVNKQPRGQPNDEKPHRMIILGQTERKEDNTETANTPTVLFTQRDTVLVTPKDSSRDNTKSEGFKVEPVTAEEELQSCKQAMSSAKTLFLRLESQTTPDDVKPNTQKEKSVHSSPVAFFKTSLGFRIPLACDTSPSPTSPQVIPSPSCKYAEQSEEKAVLQAVSNPFLAHCRIKQKQVIEKRLETKEKELKNEVEALQRQMSEAKDEKPSYTIIRNGSYAQAVPLRRSDALPRRLAEAEKKHLECLKSLQDIRKEIELLNGRVEYGQ